MSNFGIGLSRRRKGGKNFHTGSGMCGGVLFHASRGWTWSPRKDYNKHTETQSLCFIKAVQVYGCLP